MLGNLKKSKKDHINLKKVGTSYATFSAKCKNVEFFYTTQLKGFIEIEQMELKTSKPHMKLQLNFLPFTHLQHSIL